MFRTSSHTRLTLLMVVILGGCLVSAPADAKKSKRKRKAPTTIQMTGVKSFDKVFRQAKKINKRIKDAESDLRDSRKALRSALGLTKKATYVDGLKELKERADGKLRVYVKNGRATLKAKEAVPTDVQNGIDAVNDLTRTIPSSVRNLKGAGTESVKMFRKAQKFPSNIARELGSQGVDGLLAILFKLPKITKRTVRNVRVMGAMSKRTGKTIKELSLISSTVTDIF
jgi:hypothetical protein